MTPIYTFGSQPARRNLTLPDLRQAKADGRKLTQANATRDVPEEAAADLRPAVPTRNALTSAGFLRLPPGTPRYRMGHTA